MTCTITSRMDSESFAEQRYQRNERRAAEETDQTVILS